MIGFFKDCSLLGHILSFSNFSMEENHPYRSCIANKQQELVHTIVCSYCQWWLELTAIFSSLFIEKVSRTSSIFWFSSSLIPCWNMFC